MTIKLTDAAVAQVRRSAGEDAEATPLVLRIAAMQRGDGAIDYAMGFDEIDESDSVHEYDGLTVVVAATSIDLLGGAVLDYVDVADGEFRFIFLNPNDPHYVPPNSD